MQIFMLKTFMLILFSVAYTATSGKAREPLSITIEPGVYKSAHFKIYQVTLGNFNDSIVCILRSPVISLNGRQGPFELVAVSRENGIERYSPQYSVLDTSIIYEAPLYLGSLLLPGHTMNFSLKIPASNREQVLNVEYFRMYDIHYRAFHDSMMNGDWYESYFLRETTVPLSSATRR